MSTRIDTMAATDMDAAIAREAAAPALLDEREFHALYARTAAPLRAYVVRTLGSALHADDIVQDTYLRVLRKPVPTRTDDELRAYVFRIASNLVIDHWRSHRHESSGEVPDCGAPASDSVTRVDMQRLLTKLTPRERQMMWLAHVEGVAHREIAATLGLRTGSIRVLLSRARHRLARILRESGHTPGERR